GVRKLERVGKSSLSGDGVRRKFTDCALMPTLRQSPAAATIGKIHRLVGWVEQQKARLERAFYCETHHRPPAGMMGFARERVKNAFSCSTHPTILAHTY